MSCEYLLDSKCLFAIELINMSVPTTTHVCTYCLSCEKPKQLNKATASIAINVLLSANNFDDSNTKHRELKDILTPPKIPYGPGTELKKLVSWFVWLRDVKDCRACYDREQQMNQWGPDECRNNISTIVEWLRESATKHSMPFSETLVKILINKAIRNSEKHYEVVRSSNNSST